VIKVTVVNYRGISLLQNYIRGQKNMELERYKEEEKIKTKGRYTEQYED
jgi:hypothetical protein